MRKIYHTAISYIYNKTSKTRHTHTYTLGQHVNLSCVASVDDITYNYHP